MSVVKYYLSESAYAYPSSNADDGGEDNNEYNLRTITDKIAVKSFIVMRAGKYEEYFKFNDSTSTVLSVSGGECCIGGYYCNLGDMILPVTEKSSSGEKDINLLSGTTPYNIVVQIFRDSNSNIRGDGTNIKTQDRECRGVALVLATDDELDKLSPSDYLNLGKFTSDPHGRIDTSSFEYNVFRYCFLNMKMILTNNNMDIEEWVNYSLSHLNKLSYYVKDTDKEPRATLTLSQDSSGNNTFIYKAGDYTYDISDVEKRTRVAVAKQMTSLRTPQVDSTDIKTYNGESTLICRADHNHDGRYLLRNYESLVPQIVGTPLQINGATTIDTKRQTAGSGKFVVLSHTAEISSGDETSDSAKISLGNEGLVLSAEESVKITGNTSKASFNVGLTTYIRENVTVENSTLTVNGETNLNGNTTVGTTTSRKNLTVNGIVTVEGSGTGVVVKEGSRVRISPVETSDATHAAGTFVLASPDLSKTYVSIYTDNATYGEKKGYISLNGSITAGGNITASKVYNAVWNDYAELYEKSNPLAPSIPGTVICKIPGESTYGPSTKKSKRLVVGVVSDTYGHILGGKSNKSLEDNLQTHYPVAVSGRVSVRVKPGVKVKEGDLLCADDKGYATVKKFFTRGTVVGKALESGQGKVLIQVMMK